MEFWQDHGLGAGEGKDRLGGSEGEGQLWSLARALGSSWHHLRKETPRAGRPGGGGLWATAALLGVDAGDSAEKRGRG